MPLPCQNVTHTLSRRDLPTSTAPNGTPSNTSPLPTHNTNSSGTGNSTPASQATTTN
ncbi:hypothetical protein EMPG_15822 [Blastomyces silverae]|uniref:Uncharacterized protein n=1 Tax=Blastomyces silverae TaxID=2060906 RepID=A0A0H1BBI3_9EURO|nr:hypothetical protein EMPG_15822 [Blastomyces silverae]